MADRNPDPVEVIARIHAHNCGIADEPQAWEQAGIYQSAREEIDALESAGLRIVSLEPTEEMVRAVYSLAVNKGIANAATVSARPTAADYVRAALSAAPKRGGE